MPADPTPTADPFDTMSLADPQIRRFMRDTAANGQRMTFGNVPMHGNSDPFKDYEHQFISFDEPGASKGQLKLAFRGTQQTVDVKCTTSLFDFNVTPAGLQTLIEALANVGVGNIECAGGPTLVEGIGIRLKGALVGLQNLLFIPEDVTVATASDVPVGVTVRKDSGQEHAFVTGYAMSALSCAYAQDVQTITLTGTSGGVLKFGFEGSVDAPVSTVWTANVAWNADSSTVKAAMLAAWSAYLPTTDHFAVSQGVSGAWVATFGGSLPNWGGPCAYDMKVMKPLVLDTSGLTGGAPVGVVTHTTTGKGFDTTVWPSAGEASDVNWWTPLSDGSNPTSLVYKANGLGLLRDYSGGPDALCAWVKPFIKAYMASRIAYVEYISNFFVVDDYIYKIASKRSVVYSNDDESMLDGYDSYSSGTRSRLWESMFPYHTRPYKRSLERSLGLSAGAASHGLTETYFDIDIHKWHGMQMSALKEVSPPSVYVHYSHPVGGFDSWWNPSGGDFQKICSDVMRYIHRKLFGSGCMGALNSNFYPYYVAGPSPTFTANAGTDVLTLSEDIDTFLPVFLTSTGTLPAGLTTGKIYWVVRTGSGTIKLARTRKRAVAGTTIDITNAGTGTHRLWAGNVTVQQFIESRGLYAQEVGALVDEFGLKNYAEWMAMNDAPSGNPGISESIGFVGLRLNRYTVEGMCDLWKKAKADYMPAWQVISYQADGQALTANEAFYLNEFYDTPDTITAGTTMTAQHALDLNEYLSGEHKATFEDPANAQLFMNAQRAPL